KPREISHRVTETQRRARMSDTRPALQAARVERILECPSSARIQVSVPLCLCGRCLRLHRTVRALPRPPLAAQSQERGRYRPALAAQQDRPAVCRPRRYADTVGHDALVEGALRTDIDIVPQNRS